MRYLEKFIKKRALHVIGFTRASKQITPHYFCQPYLFLKIFR
jgi:hypothetical protein